MNVYVWQMVSTLVVPHLQCIDTFLRRESENNPEKRAQVEQLTEIVSANFGTPLRYEVFVLIAEIWIGRT